MDKKKALVFSAIIALALAPVLFTDSFADSPIRYRDYSIQKINDNTYSQTVGLDPYVWNGSQFVDRIIQNNGTHFNVYSEYGSINDIPSTA